MAFPKAMPLVEIVWIDSNMTSGWHSVENMLHTVRQEAMECRTAGYLFHDQEDRVTVVGNQSDTEQVADAMTIPRVAIVSMTTIREVEP